MGSWLSEREQRLVAGAAAASAATPVPTQIVSNGEYLPPSQSATQKQVEAALMSWPDPQQQTARLEPPAVPANELRFMAAAFLAMNEIYGNVFQVTAAEAREPELMLARTKVSQGSSSSTSRPTSYATTSSIRSSWTSQASPSEQLEPADEAGRRVVARPLQVPELHEGDLLRPATPPWRF